MMSEAAEMPESLQRDYKTTIEAFHAFVDDRPESEKWELIDGEIVLNPTATNRHQVIVGRLIHELLKAHDSLNGSWEVMPGISTFVQDDAHNEPIPDVMIVPTLNEVSNSTFEAMVVFEVLSPFSLRRDMVHKRNFYTRIESLTHYVVLAQDKREAIIFARSNSFEPQILKAADAKIEIAPLGVSLALADIYRGVLLD
jgi:Uma2 family endonuclease